MVDGTDAVAFHRDTGALNPLNQCFHACPFVRSLGAAIFIERFAIERETQLLAAALVVTSVAPSNAASHSVLFVGRCTVTISFVGLGNTMHSYTHINNS